MTRSRSSRRAGEKLDAARFIAQNLPLTPVPGLPEIVLHTAHPGTGLMHWLESQGESAEPPYWAYHWAGGVVLARFCLEHPDRIAGRCVLDLGAGSGLVGIAAAVAGASAVFAAEIDPHARVALAMNARANGVEVRLLDGDVLAGAPPLVEVVLVGDLFYNGDVARRTTAFLDRCLDAGIEVLVGDPFREHLPLDRLQVLAEYAVADVGDRRDGDGRRAAVFSFGPAPG